MRWWQRSGRAAAGGALVATALVTGPAAGTGVGDDSPLDDPTPVWVVDVACGTTAEVESTRAPDERRYCATVVDDGAVYLLEHSAAGYPTGQFRLLSVDAGSGEQRWATLIGPASSIAVETDALILSDKGGFQVVDPGSGAVRFERRGRLAGANRYGTLVVEDAAGVSAGLDARSGERLWNESGPVSAGVVCRDVVVLVPRGGSEPAPWRVVDQHTGALRWTGEVEFDPDLDHIGCGRQSIFTTDGEALASWYAVDGWPEWVTEIEAGAGSFEVYRDVVLVRAAGEGGGVTAVAVDDGELRWSHDVDDVGEAVSSRFRLREDEAGVFTLDVGTGEVVARLPASSSGTPAQLLGISGSRVLVLDGAVVSAYGSFDLGLAWQFELPIVPDDVEVDGATMVVRFGESLVGFTDDPAGSAP